MSERVPIIPLIAPGKYDWRRVDDKTDWLRGYEFDGINVIINEETSQISNANGTRITRNQNVTSGITEHDYIFFLAEQNPLSLSAVTANTAFSINIEVTRSIGNWFIRITDNQGNNTDYYKFLKIGSNIFEIPAGGNIKFWNLSPILNTTEQINYSIKQANGSTAKLVMYGNLKSIKNFSWHVNSDDTISRNNQYLSGQFNGIFKNFTTLQKLALTESLPFSGTNQMIPDYYCKGMFEGCTSLKQGVIFNNQLSGNLSCGQGCFSGMFKDCTALTGVTGTGNNLKLYANYTAPYAYASMFEGCTSLTGCSFTANQNPGDAADRQFTFLNMFKGSGLEKANIYLGVNMKTGNGCYKNMFSGCANLSGENSIIFDKDTSLGCVYYESCFENMFVNTQISRCDSLFTSPYPSGYWTNCCKNMFAGCTKLTVGTAILGTDEIDITVPDGEPQYTWPSVYPTYGDWVGYPDYKALAHGNGGSSGEHLFSAPGWFRITAHGTASVSIDGKSLSLYTSNTYDCETIWIIPVKGGHTVSWTGAYSVGWAGFLGDKVGYPDYKALTSGGTEISNGQYFKPPYNGWIRLSVLPDNGLMQYFGNNGDNVIKMRINGDTYVYLPIHTFWENTPAATYLFPVVAGYNYQINLPYHDNNIYCNYEMRYAPDVGGGITFPIFPSYTPSYIPNGSTFNVPVEGWIVVDAISGACLRFSIDGAQWNTGALPLYGARISGSRPWQIAEGGNSMSFMLPVQAGTQVKIIRSENQNTHEINADARMFFLAGENYDIADRGGEDSSGGADSGQSGSGSHTETVTVVTVGNWNNVLSLDIVGDTFSSNACNGMFSGCTSMKFGPIFTSNISIASNASDVFDNMFAGCTSLSALNWMNTTLSISNKTKHFTNFVTGPTASGILFTSNTTDLTSYLTNGTILPSNWKIYTNI